MSRVLTLAYGAVTYVIQLEERDRMSAHPDYAEYRRRVPMLVPSWPRRAPAANPARTVRA
jgi:protein-S-isoprenylcysteine O-methyltransferase Ste14